MFSTDGSECRHMQVEAWLISQLFEKGTACGLRFKHVDLRLRTESATRKACKFANIRSSINHYLRLESSLRNRSQAFRNCLEAVRVTCAMDTVRRQAD